MRWLSLITGILLTAASVGLIACAAGPTKTAPPQAPEAGAAPQPPIDVRVNDISMLYTEIRQFRREANLPSEPDNDVVIQFTRQPKALVNTCEPTDDRCSDVCTLADHICENAEDICNISRQLTKHPSYAWARDKCNRANVSCNEARQQCCGCVERAKNGGDVGQSFTTGKEPANGWWN